MSGAGGDERKRGGVAMSEVGGVVELDEERKAAMMPDLLVVLCRYQ
jgi:hypothetical protein